MKKKYHIDHNAITIVGGICFILVALVTLFSANTPFEFLLNTIKNSFGFVGFWLILPFIVILGLYLILEKKVIKIKLGTELWGLSIIILCFLILSSHWGSEGSVANGVPITGQNLRDGNGAAHYITFSNSLTIFNEIKEANPSVVGPNPRLGGGSVGYILAGALNSAVTPLGLNIICWVLFSGALLIIFNKQILRIVGYLKTRKGSRKQPKQFKEVDLMMDENEPEEPVRMEDNPIEVNTFNDNKPIFEAFQTNKLINNDYELKKARFINQDETGAQKDIYENDLSKAQFEPSKPIEVSKEENSDSNPFGNIYSKEEEKVEPYPTPIIEQPIEQPIEKNVQPITPHREDPQEFIKETPKEVVPPKPTVIKNYIFPSIELLDENTSGNDTEQNEASCLEKTEIINRTLANLQVGAEVVSHTIGPSVTRFDLKTNDDVSVSGIARFTNDIAVKLGGVPVRFEPIVVGKSTSGLEVPNDKRSNVTLREALEEMPTGEKNKLNIPFGKSISGELKFANLADFPHLLIAGTTGSGKSIFVHATIVSLLMRNKPDELKLVMVDPKKVEMSYYDDIPHLLTPVISDVRKVYVCFQKLVTEMERRYDLFRDNRVRDIKGFNMIAKSKNLERLPYIVVFIDEYADLIETCKEVRDPVVRIVQKARAAGIHMVFATQRPSVNVIDGVIKGNVSTRVALMCASPTDSITVIGAGGAEQLLGNGDMLVDCPLISRVMKTRVQGCYVSETEILRVCDFLREHYQPQFDPNFLNLEPVVEEKPIDDYEAPQIDKAATDEEAYQRIKEDACHREYMSISYITRTYNMGFSRAGKMFTRLQKEGVVATGGDARGSKVLMFVPYEQQAGSVEQSTFIPDEENN